MITNSSPLDYFIKDQDNYNLLCAKWVEVKDKIQPVIDELIAYKDRLAPITKKDAIYWYGNSKFSKFAMFPEDQFDTQYDYIVQFLSIHKDYLTTLLIECNYETLAK